MAQRVAVCWRGRTKLAMVAAGARKSLLTQFPLLGVLVALSGAAGLIYELLWIRALGLHFGTTTPAISAVTASFMAGLALGNHWFGQLADKNTRPFALYRRLELGCAASGLCVSLFFFHGGDWLDGAARLCMRAGSLATLAMAALLSVCMLTPTILMGGTLPVLTRALARTRPASALSQLYLYNTLGAIAGALLPDFVLIPRFGWTAAACTAATLNLGVGLAVTLVERTNRHPFTLEVSQTARAPSLSTPRRTALMLSATTGLCALGLEVLWSRTLQQWAAALLTSFAVLLAVYLSALALGTAVAQRFVRRSTRPLHTASLLIALAASCSVLPLWAAGAWRKWERDLWPRPEGLRRMGLAHEALDALWHALYLEGAVCLLLGASFPFVAAAWLRRAQPGAGTGILFAYNTLGGVLGSLLVGFVALPNWGEQASYCVLALLLSAAAAAGISLAPGGTTVRRSRVLGALCCAIVPALVLALPSGQLQRAHFHFEGAGELLALREGATTSAAVVEHYVYGQPHYRELQTPGISMSSTRLGARRYMSLMAHAGLLLAGSPRRALLICYGVGNTARALLSEPGLAQLDVVDISPEVLALAPYFATDGSAALDDPRSRVFVDDGRHHLITHASQYDVITAEPPPPNYAGVVNLYSREFYQLAKQRLSADGVMTQWLPVFQLSDSDALAMIAAFVAEFPHTALLYGYGQQLVLVGSRAPLGIDAARLPEFDRAPLQAALQSNGIGSIYDILGATVQTDAELRRSLSEVAPLSDQRPIIEYLSSALDSATLFTARFVDDPARAYHLVHGQLNAEQESSLRAAGDAVRRILRVLPLLELPRSESRELRLGRELSPALLARPDDDGLWSLLAIDAERDRLAQRALAQPDAAALLQPVPSSPPRGRVRQRYLVLQDALWLRARRAFYQGQYAAALTQLDQITPEPHMRASHALFVAGCLRALGKTEQSARAFLRSAAISGDATLRSECDALARAAGQPFEAAWGPWSLR